MNNEFKFEKKEILKTCALYGFALCGFFVFSWSVSQYIGCSLQEGIYSNKSKKKPSSRRGGCSRLDRLKSFQNQRQKE